MHIRKVLWGAAILLLGFACSGPKNLVSLKTDAENFAAAGNYQQAFTTWKQHFTKVGIEAAAGADFASAANIALMADDTVQAKQWFDQARYKSFADAKMYQNLATIYRSEDNLSKELSALEYFTENFSQENASVNTRLFAIYNEIDNQEKALAMWEKMDAAGKSSEDNLTALLGIYKKQENKTAGDSIANLVLTQNPENIAALEWNAKKYYWAGQKRYDREMVKYNKKKTRKNYNILLKELKLVTADFKKALPYLNKLWKNDKNKEYASYFVNIYARFGDKQKVSYYKKFTK